MGHLLRRCQQVGIVRIYLPHKVKGWSKLFTFQANRSQRHIAVTIYIIRHYNWNVKGEGFIGYF